MPRARKWPRRWRISSGLAGSKGIASEPSRFQEPSSHCHLAIESSQSCPHFISVVCIPFSKQNSRQSKIQSSNCRSLARPLHWRDVGCCNRLRMASRRLLCANSDDLPHLSISICRCPQERDNQRVLCGRRGVGGHLALCLHIRGKSNWWALLMSNLVSPTLVFLSFFPLDFQLRLSTCVGSLLRRLFAPCSDVCLGNLGNWRRMRRYMTPRLRF